MKINKLRLKKIIREELEKISETKEDHILGITNKITRLQAARDDAQQAMKDMEDDAVDEYDLSEILATNEYYNRQVEAANLYDKIEMLIKQLRQLKQDVPGPLERA